MLFMHDTYISLFKAIELLQMYLLFEKKNCVSPLWNRILFQVLTYLFKVPNTAVLAQCGKEADNTR